MKLSNLNQLKNGKTYLKSEALFVLEDDIDTKDHVFVNQYESLKGCYIQIAGSAHKNTELKLLKYSHELVRCITIGLLKNGTKLIVGTGAEEMVDNEPPKWYRALYYDWNILEIIGKYKESLGPRELHNELPLALVVSSEKAESDIPLGRREFWYKLIETETICLEYLPPGWNAGAYKRAIEADYGDGLIIIGGGEGVEHSCQLYLKSGKPVIPVDLPIISRFEDGKGGASEIARLALLNPCQYLGSVPNATTRLAGISTNAGHSLINKITPSILRLLSEAITESDIRKMKERKKDPRSVFVVHGRNEVLRRELFTFLRSIGIVPIEWTKAIKLAGSGSPHISDILNAAFDFAQAVIVLLTPDDEARLREDFHSGSEPNYEKYLTPQARPNVIFEAGMAFGRNAARTILVEIGELRPFSDIAGRHTVRLDNSTEKRQDLAMRLHAAGCKVNLDGTDWHTTGEFQVTKQGSTTED